MGARGALKIVPDPDGGVRVPGSAQDDVPALAPNKPQAVADDPDLSALWDEVVPDLDKAGLLSTPDALAVELALRHVLVSRRAFGELADSGLTIMGKDELKKHPAEAIFRMESMQAREYLRQLGATFAARTRLPAKGGDDDAGDNPFA